MNSQAELLRRRTDLATDGEFGIDRRILELVRCLAQCVAEKAMASSPVSPTQELILDIEVDGVRYLLVRQVSQTSQLQRFLSPRELEIGRMVAKGYPNKIIAAVLEISSWTVCSHLRRIFAKLGVTSRAAMVARIVQDGGIITAPACPEWGHKGSSEKLRKS